MILPKHPCFSQHPKPTSASTSLASGAVISLVTPANSVQNSPIISPNFSYQVKNRNFVRAISKNEAHSVVLQILRNPQRSSSKALFHLSSFSALPGKNIKSKVYTHYYVLCHANTRSSARWAVCKSVESGGCSVELGCQRFEPDHGTKNLLRHKQSHEKSLGDQQHYPRNIGKKAKRTICRAAALVCTGGLRPFAFAEGLGMRRFISSVFSVGQSIAAGDNVNIDDLIPSARAVHSAVNELCIEKRKELSNNFDSILKCGGGMTVDGVTLKVQEKHFYDLTLHYFDIDANTTFPKRRTALKCRTIVLTESDKGHSASDIRRLLNEQLLTHYSFDLDYLKRSFTLVTDWASVMPNIVGASVSANVAPINEKWMGCIGHQLNTVMKSCFKLCETDPILYRIIEDLNNVKILVRIFKQSSWDSRLGDGNHLIQEVETRFATTYAVAERFMRAGLAALAVVEDHDSAPAYQAKTSIMKTKDAGSLHEGFPALEAIVDACDMIVYAQKKLEAAETSTGHLVLPMIEKCNKELRRIELGGPVDRGFTRGRIRPSQLSLGEKFP